MDSRLYRTGLVLLVTILGASTIQAQQVSDSQRWRDSLTVLNRQIAESQWSTDLHLRKATANLELKQWEYAIDEYALVLQHEPRNLQHCSIVHMPTPTCAVSTWHAMI